MEKIAITVVAFWVVAIAASLLYGVKAVSIFQVTPQKGRDVWAWWVHQFWLNFLGALLGWLALGFLLRKYSICVFSECAIFPNEWDIVASIIAFVGVTGYLPGSVVAIISGFSSLAGKLAEIAAAWLSKR